MGLKEDIFAILDKAEAEGKDVPTLRTIRAELGKGSLTTISEAVKTWKQERIRRVSPLPDGFDDDQNKALSSCIWGLVEPIMQKTLDQLQQAADARIHLQEKESEKLKEAAGEVLAEAEARTREFDALRREAEDLRVKLAQSEEALKGVREALAAKTQELSALMEQHRAALDRAAAAEATCATMRKMIPLLDPQHVRNGAVRT